MRRKWKKRRNFQIYFFFISRSRPNRPCSYQTEHERWNRACCHAISLPIHSVMPFKFVITSTKIWCFTINPTEQSLTCFQLIRQLFQFYGCHFTKRSLNRTTICWFREAKWKASSIPTLEMNAEKSAMTNWQLNDRRKKQKKKQINENQFIKIAIIIAHCP